MSVVQLLSEAEQELEAAALHYESQQAGLGAALLAEVEKTSAASQSSLSRPEPFGVI